MSTHRGLVTHPSLSNFCGPLSQQPDVQQRLRQVMREPRKYWDRDNGIILREREPGTLGLTLWQAILRVDPTFPRVGPSSTTVGGRRIPGTWARYPDSMLIARAIKYAGGIR